MFSMQGVYRFASPDIVHEDFDGECVMLNLASGSYYALSKSATQLINAMLAGVPVDQLAALAGDAFGGADVQSFFQELERLELIAADADREPTPLSESLQQEAQGWPDQPTVEAYDDLADLILADPIHDTDESAGWPNLPATDSSQQKRAG